MSDEVADLYVTLRAETAPMTAGFVEAGAAGEAMAAEVTASLGGVSAEVTRVAEQNAMLGTSAEAAAGTWAAACAEMTASAGEAGAAMAEIQAEIEAAVAAELGLATETATTATEVSASAAEMSTAWVDANGRMRDANGRFIASNQEAAASAKTRAEETTMSSGELDAAMAGLAATEAKRTDVLAGLDAAQKGTAEGMGTLKNAASTFKASFADSAAAIGLTSGQLGGLGLAAAAAGGVAVKMAGDFQQSTTKLVTSASLPVDQLKQVQDGIVQMAGQVGYSAEELSAAMYKASSGVSMIAPPAEHGAASLQVLKAAAEGAKAEGSDLTTVADAVTTSLIDFHQPASAAADVTSKLVGATAQGKMSFEELAGSLSNVAPVASAAHISMDDMLGTLASMTSHGISAQQATQNMADAIRHLQNPTATMRSEMATFGISADDVAQKLGQRGLSGTMQYLQQAVQKAMPPGTDKVILDLKNAVQQSSPAVQELAQKVMDGSMSMGEFTKAAKGLDVVSAKQATSFATLAGQTHQLGSENMTGAQAAQTYGGALAKLMGDSTGLKVALMTTGENADNTNQSIKAVADSSADAAGNVKGWDEIQGEFNTKMSQAKDSLGGLAISIGMKLLPVVTAIAGAFADATNWLSQHQTIAVIAAGVIGVILVTAFVALGVAAAQAAIGVIAATWPILAIIAAVALLAYGIYELVQHWQGVSDFFSGLWEKVKSAFSTAIDWIVNIFKGWYPLILGILSGGILLIPALIVKYWDNIVSFFSGLWDKVAGFFKSGWDKVKSVWDTITKFFSQSPQQIGQEIGHAVGAAAKAVVDWVKNLGKDIENGWNATIAWFKALPGRIKDFFVGAGNWIADKAKELWDGFTHGVSTAWNATVAWFKALPGRIKDFLVGAGTWIADKAKELWDGFTTGITNEWNNTVAWFKALPGHIKDFFTDAPSWLLEHGKNILEGLWNGFTGWVSNIWNGIKDFISGFLDGFKSGFGIASPSTVMLEIGQWIIQGLWNGIKNIWSSLSGFVQGLPQTIINFFAGAANWLVSAGHDLLVGLWNGITSMTSWVWDKLTSWASSLWGGVKSALGIASPSVLAHETGMFLMQGLANGIDDHAHLAVTAAQTVADKVATATQSTAGKSLQALSITAGTLGSDGASLPTSYSAGALTGSSAVLPGIGTGGGNVTVVHVNPTVQGNVWTTKDLVTELQQELLRHGIRNTGSGINYGFGAGS